MTGFQKKYLLVAAFVIVQGLVGILGGLAFASVPGENTIFPGVFIKGIEVGGLTGEQAKLLLERDYDKLETQNLVFQYNGREWQFSYKQLGIKFNIAATVKNALQEGRGHNRISKILQMFRIRYYKSNLPLEYSLDEAQLRDVLKGIAREINISKIDASVVLEKGRIKVLPEKKGRELNLDASIENLKEALKSLHKGPVNLVVPEVKPKIVAADLRGITQVIGNGITPLFSSGKERTDNIYLAVNAMNGYLLPPGEVFSFDRVVGPRVTEQGYRSAPVLLNGKLVEGTGGGVCQAATTLYEAILYSGLKIEERHPHSSPPGYIGLGRDAAVVYGEMDLRFRNNTEKPVYIIASIINNRVDVKLLGAGEPGRTIQIFPEKHDSSNVAGEKKEAGRSYVRVYRIIYNNGKEDKRELVSENYYIDITIAK